MYAYHSAKFLKISNIPLLHMAENALRIKKMALLGGGTHLRELFRIIIEQMWKSDVQKTNI